MTVLLASVSPWFWVLAGLFFVTGFCEVTNIFGNWHGGGDRWPKWMP